MNRNLALVAFGANLSPENIDMRTHCESIFAELAKFEVIRSRFYETPAFPEGSGPNFINAAFSIRTDLAASDFLNWLHQIENKFARQRPYRWSPRSIDLDLLFFNDQILPDLELWEKYARFTTKEAMENVPDRLILPHPRLHERAFVLAPLLDIAPSHIHPIYRKTVRELWAQIPQTERDLVKPIDSHIDP